MAGYQYAEQRKSLFTDEGQRKLIAMRDRALSLLGESGAVRAEEIMRGSDGDSWQLLACLDRLVELGDLKEVPNPHCSFAQNRIFVSGRKLGGR